MNELPPEDPCVTHLERLWELWAKASNPTDADTIEREIHERLSAFLRIAPESRSADEVQDAVQDSLIHVVFKRPAVREVLRQKVLNFPHVKIVDVAIDDGRALPKSEADEIVDAARSQQVKRDERVRPATGLSVWVITEPLGIGSAQLSMDLMHHLKRSLVEAPLSEVGSDSRKPWLHKQARAMLRLGVTIRYIDRFPMTALSLGKRVDRRALRRLAEAEILAKTTNADSPTPADPRLRRASLISVSTALPRPPMFSTIEGVNHAIARVRRKAKLLLIDEAKHGVKGLSDDSAEIDARKVEASRPDPYPAESDLTMNRLMNGLSQRAREVAREHIIQPIWFGGSKPCQSDADRQVLTKNRSAIRDLILAPCHSQLEPEDSEIVHGMFEVPAFAIAGRLNDIFKRTCSPRDIERRARTLLRDVVMPKIGSLGVLALMHALGDSIADNATALSKQRVRDAISMHEQSVDLANAVKLAFTVSQMRTFQDLPEPMRSERVRVRNALIQPLLGDRECDGVLTGEDRELLRNRVEGRSLRRGDKEQPSSPLEIERRLRSIWQSTARKNLGPAGVHLLGLLSEKRSV